MCKWQKDFYCIVKRTKPKSDVSLPLFLFFYSFFYSLLEWLHFCDDNCEDGNLDKIEQYASF